MSPALGNDVTGEDHPNHDRSFGGDGDARSECPICGEYVRVHQHLPDGCEEYDA